MALHEACAEDFVLPVGALSEQARVAVHLVVVAVADYALVVKLGLIFGIFTQVHHVEALGCLLPCHIAVVCDVGVAGGASARSHHDYAIGACGAIYGTCRGILEHVDAHNVARSYGGERIHCGLTVGTAHPVEAAYAGAAAHGHTVDDVQGFVGRVKGACATDTH